MIINEITELIQMYLPALIAAAEGFSVFFVLIKKLKEISFKDDATELTEEVKTMIEENKKLRASNKELKKQLSLIIDKNMKIHNYEVNIEHEKE